MEMNRMQAIRAFFEADGGRKIDGKELIEFKKVDPDGLQELATMAAAALGVTLTASPA